MTNEEKRMQENDNLKLVYGQLCNSYRAIDDFRTKLLGFLPLATGTGIFFLVTDSEQIKQMHEILPVVGAFGFFITLGLFLFELYGIKKCDCLIKTGIKLEEQLGLEYGQFIRRPRGIFGLINEPFAAALIYSTVLAAWVYIALIPLDCDTIKIIAAVFVLIIGFFWVLFYNKSLVDAECPPYGKSETNRILKKQ
jgi:hypothetical protein